MTRSLQYIRLRSLVRPDAIQTILLMPLTRTLTSTGRLFRIKIRTVGRVLVNKPHAPVTHVGAHIFIPGKEAFAKTYASFGIPITPRRVSEITCAFEDERLIFVVVFFPPPQINEFLKNILAYKGEQVTFGGSYLVQFFDQRMRTVRRVPLSLVAP